MIPQSVIELAGFTLGHSLWNVCDFEDEDEVLCPLAFTVNGSDKQLLRFEDDDQEEALEKAFSYLSEQKSLSHWALAHEGIFQSESGPIDVLLVDAWGHGLEDPVTFAQPFKPAASGQFELLGKPLILIDGQPQNDPALSDQLRVGVLSHQKAAELWPAWQGW